MTYRGFWIVCRNCLFPIRLPSLLKTLLHLENSRSNSILLACPVCAYVEPYAGGELEAIAFRIPDPFGQKKAALYVVRVPCGVQDCEETARIYAVAATTLSVTSLLQLWRHWVIHATCRNHSFRARRCSTWSVYDVHQVHQTTFERI